MSETNTGTGTANSATPTAPTNTDALIAFLTETRPVVAAEEHCGDGHHENCEATKQEQLKLTDQIIAGGENTLAAFLNVMSMLIAFNPETLGMMLTLAGHHAGTYEREIDLIEARIKVLELETTR